MIIILPQLIINVFLLHVLEILFGFKLYDYFTYSDYRFRHREAKWQNRKYLDRSIIHSWRSIDNFCFSSQYYFVISLSTWGIIYLYLGMTTMIRNSYNPFADPMLLLYVLMVMGCLIPIRHSMLMMSGYVKLWEQRKEEKLLLDTGALNRLDKEHNFKRHIRQLQSNPFRHKFVNVNREWIINNIARVLLGKNLMSHKNNQEADFLKAIYQKAINAEAVDEKLRVEQGKIQEDLGLLPYNKPIDADTGIAVVSDDSISDIPHFAWEIKNGLTK